MRSACDIIAALGGDWHGEFGLCPGPGHSKRDRSLKVWQSDGCVWVHSFAGDSWRDCRRHVGLEGGSVRHSRAENVRLSADEIAEREQRTEYALKIWWQCRAADGSVVQSYLQRRGINLLPPSLRHHLSLKHTNSGLCFPAMVAIVQAPNRRPMAIHRTWLLEDGSGRPNVSTQKAALGCCAGGAVRLGPAAESICVAEGIESTLSLMIFSGLSGWAGISAPGLNAMVLPDQVRQVLIGADNDANGAGLLAAEAAAERWVAEGRRVDIAVPPAVGNDFNDVLMQRTKTRAT